MKKLTASLSLALLLAVPGAYVMAQEEQQQPPEDILQDQQLDQVESDLEEVVDRIGEIKGEEDMQKRKELLDQHRDDMRNTLDETSSQLEEEGQDNGGLFN